MARRCRDWMLVCALSTGLLQAQVVYNSTQGNYFSYVTPPAAYLLDDGKFAASAALPVNARSMEIGYEIAGIGEASFDIYINLYDDPSGTLAGILNTTNIARAVLANPTANPLLLESYRMQVVGELPGSYTTGALNLAQGAAVFPNRNFAVELVFMEPNSTTNLSERASALFAGGAMLAGENRDFFYTDFNNNSKYDDPSEKFSTGNPEYLSHFYLKIDTRPVRDVQATVIFESWKGSTLPDVSASVDGGSPVIYGLTRISQTIGQFVLQVPDDNLNHTIKVKSETTLSETLSIGSGTISIQFDGDGNSGQVGAGLKLGDTNNDNRVNDFDLAAAIFDFGQAPTGSNGNTDLNGDGIDDDFDLIAVIFNFLKTGT